MTASGRCLETGPRPGVTGKPRLLAGGKLPGPKGEEKPHDCMIRDGRIEGTAASRGCPQRGAGRGARVAGGVATLRQRPPSAFNGSLMGFVCRPSSMPQATRRSIYEQPEGPARVSGHSRWPWTRRAISPDRCRALGHKRVAADAAAAELAMAAIAEAVTPGPAVANPIILWISPPLGPAASEAVITR
jgi:hypothetical protein